MTLLRILLARKGPDLEERKAGVSRGLAIENIIVAEVHLTSHLQDPETEEEASQE